MTGVGLPTHDPAVPATVFQGADGDVATWFERVVADLVGSFGRVPVSIGVLVLAALLGAIVVPLVVSGIRGLVAAEPLGGYGGSIAGMLYDLVPRSFSELLVRTVQIAIAIVAALSLVVVWGYADLVSDVRGSIASDLADVIGLSLTLVLIGMAFVGSDLLQRAINRFGDRADGITDHQQEIVLRVGQVTLFLALGAAILTLWSFDLTGLLVGAGFLGIVVGFAARETLGSLIAGFVLMFSRPFTIGDWVEIGETEGVITDITMFNTRMQNIDAESLVLPNDVVSNSTIINRSRKGRLQIRREVNVDYDTDPERAIAVATDAMSGVEVVIDSPEPQAVPIRFEDSAILLELRFWITDPRPQRKWSAVAGVLRAVKEGFDEEGVEIPFPQRTLSHRGEDATALSVVDRTDPGNGEQAPAESASEEDTDADAPADQERENGDQPDETDGETAEETAGRMAGDRRDGEGTGEQDR